jgi:integrase
MPGKSSTKDTRSTKPRKDFPLFLHRTGQWCKKIKGRFCYFGVDALAAEQRYLNGKDDLAAGRKPRDAEGLTVRDMVNKFLTYKKGRVGTGELSPRTFNDYDRISGVMVRFFGPGRHVGELRPEDFERFRVDLAKVRGVVSLANAITRARVVFKWAFDNDEIEKPVKFGSSFKKPNKKTMRRAKRDGGSRVYDADQLRKLLEGAGGTMRAMILLGVNAGLGQTDVAGLPLDAVDLTGCWLNYPRTKTEVDRRCPLWPETVKAIKAALAVRPQPQDEADAGLVFLTHRGARWIRWGTKAESESLYFNDFIAAEFDKLARNVKVERRGSFYNLRHTFRTIADASKDQPAVNLIMGHTSGGMDEEYRDRIDDKRLQDVVNVVRSWLWAKKRI